MAISWISALKVIPWGDVIEAAPGLVKGARKVFSRTQAEPAASQPSAGEPAESPSQRIERLETAVARMGEQQQAAAALLESLAEHNAKVVEAIEVLRLRSKLLIGACAVLLLAVAALAAQVLR
ncbi:MULTISPECIES: hypothetical protein [unclassified Rhizobacter]|uniref:hypothetical protein n=1 Tax=unclassified Rhizobacter TaxID=2640088 RepID=UPI0006FE31F6|nr:MULTISPECIES: hypothetical protein [unclassified Rhizobacter]KQU67204.1 hypothetical protein ASC88_09360 [Rhizobacter sp. Root29]KQV98085.1 hypothetical protein ASC98_08705 [Rhizobacter sp. Root1238]KRB01983.1 hypothetical protein ASE08_16265 [Rhizobacter sp. Root16D2]